MTSGDLVRARPDGTDWEVLSGPWAADGGGRRDDYGVGGAYVCCRGAGDGVVRRVAVSALRVVETAEERVARALMAGPPGNGD